MKKSVEQQKKYEWISNLSKTANGTLTGNVKMDFETYVQRQYFKQIIQAANRRLIKMTDGSFILQCKICRIWEARDSQDWIWTCTVW